MVTVKMQIRKNISKVKYVSLRLQSYSSWCMEKGDVHVFGGRGMAFTIQCIVSDLFFTIFCFNKPFSRLRLAKKCSIKFKEKKEQF